MLVIGLIVSFQGIVLTGTAISRISHQTGPGDERAKVPAGTLEPIEKAEARSVFPSPRFWPDPGEEMPLLRGLAVLLTLLFVALLCMALGSANQDLGRVEWNLQWIFTLPLPTRGIFLARTLEHSLVNAISWGTNMPLWLGIFIAGGAGGWSVPLALLCTLYINLALGALRVWLETHLRLRCSLARLKNLQAAFTIIGIVLFYVLLYVVITDPLPEWFLSFAREGSNAVFLTPPALPLVVLTSGPGGLGVLAGILAYTVLFTVLGVFLPSWLVRDGLIVSSGAYQGTRGTASEQDVKLRPAGIRRKELRLLVRDRNLMVQVLFIPLAVLGFQLVVNPEIFVAAGTNFRHGATLAFAIGTYVLMFGAFTILSVEGNSLWLLYTFPHRIESLLLRKVRLWGTVSLAYTTIILGALMARGASLTLDHAMAGAMALAGVWIYSFLAAGMGVLGTDPLMTEVRRKIHPGKMYLFMLLSACFAYGIYAEQLWPKLTLLVLCSLLALAIWQKVREEIPYLLDPTATPTPAILLSDGLIAALCFFVGGGVLMGLFAGSDPKTFPPGARITVAYVAAGLGVGLFFTASIARRGIKPLDRTAPGRLGSVASGVVGGVAAGALAMVYLYLIDRIPLLARLKEEAPDLLATEYGENFLLWFRGLAILGAPPVEEFIFRGLVFRGLRRTLPLRWSVLASAAIFAIVHPPISFLPVFGLGIATALVYERTGRLMAPILCHMAYNLIVTSFQP